MIGRAMLNRATSILIVFSMVLTSFTGLLAATGGALGQVEVSPWQSSNGDIFIGGTSDRTNYTLNTDLIMTGNLTIGRGGTVSISGGSLIFRPDYGNDGIINTADDRDFYLVIEDGGRLILNNSTLTTGIQFKTIPSLGVIVRNGGELDASDSILAFPGHLIVDDANMILHRSVITGITTVGDYTNESYFPEEVFSSSPVLLFMSSNIQLYDSRIDSIYEQPDINVSVAQMYNQQYSFVRDVNSASGERNQANYTFERTPSVTSANLANLTADDLSTYLVTSTNQLSIDGFDVGGLMFSATDHVSIQLNVKYYTDPGYTGSNSIYWKFRNGTQISTGANGMPVNTPVPYDPSLDNQRVLSVALPYMSAQDLSGLNLGFVDSDLTHGVYINKIWVTMTFQLATYKNITLAGDTSFTAVNTYLGVDLSDQTLLHNELVAMDDSSAYLYGVDIDQSQAPVQEPGLPAYVAMERTFEAVASSIGANDNSGQLIDYINALDSQYYALTNGQTMAIDGFNTSDLSGTVVRAVLYVNYAITGGTSNEYLQWGLQGQILNNTSIQLTNAGQGTKSFTLDPSVDSVEKVSNLNVQTTHVGAQTLSINKLWIDVTVSPNIYLYRWMNLTSYDSNGLPVNNGTVYSENNEHVQSYYYSSDGKLNTPPAEILAYLGRNASNYNVTGSNGKVTIPYLTQILDQQYPSGKISYSYNVVLTYVNSTGHVFSNNTGLGFGTYPDNVTKASMTVDKIIYLGDLKLDQPDLNVVSITITPSTIYEGDNVHFVAVITNSGSTAAANVKVKIWVNVNGQTRVNLTETTISSIAPYESQNISVGPIDWNSVPSGTHTLTVSVDPDNTIDELTNSNNVLSQQFTVLENRAELSITESDIAFNPQPADTNNPVTATIVVHNTAGRVSAVNTTIDLSTVSGGSNIGSINVTVPAGGSYTATFSWKPSLIGTYPVYITLNANRTILEYDYSNNAASKNINVKVSINSEDFVVGNSDRPNYTLAPTPLPGWYKNITVVENGTLTLSGYNMAIQESSNYGLQIMVQDNGKLVLTSSSIIDSSRPIKLYLQGHASLIVMNSQIMASVTIVADDNSTINMESSSIMADVVAPITSHVVLTAFNCTFSQWSSFGGHAAAFITNTKIPALSPKESAVIHHYRWLQVSVLDGTFNKLPNAYVELDYQNGGYYASGRTDANGIITFQALCDVLTKGMVKQIGPYDINTTYWYGGVAYDGQDIGSINIGAYSAPLVDPIEYVTLNIMTALPSIDPAMSLSDNLPAKNQSVSIDTTVWNNGSVSAHNVIVTLYDNGEFVSSVTIASIGPHANVQNVFIWIADYPVNADHNLTVMATLGSDTTMAWGHAYVRGIADFYVSQESIVFFSASSPTRSEYTDIIIAVLNVGDLAASNVSVYLTLENNGTSIVQHSTISNIGANSSAAVTFGWTPASAGNYNITVEVNGDHSIEEITTNNNKVTKVQKVLDYADLQASTIIFVPANSIEVTDVVGIGAMIYNIGDTNASNFVVDFYLGEPSITSIPIYETTISSLAAGKTMVVSFDWTATINPGQLSETKTFVVVVNPKHLISEIRYDNNQASQSILVSETRPDVLFPGNISVSKGTEAVNSSGVGETIEISTTVLNNGTTAASMVNFVFSVRDANNVTTFIGNITKDVGAGMTVTVNTTWLINVTMGSYTIVIKASSAIESNYSNDQVTLSFLIDPPNPVVLIDLPVSVYEPEKTIHITGTVTNKDSTAAIGGATVTMWITDMNGEIIGEKVSTTTDANGAFTIGVYLKPGLSGNYIINAHVSIGDKSVETTRNIKVEMPGGGIPWWVYALIMAIVVAVIIGFSAYLYRYGLGKMVECGECGTLIPEASKRCPKCGVEFEAGTAKCSECGAWIPSNSTSCPECGAKFITEAIEEEEDAYVKKMREQYEAYADTFKEEAKRQLDKKYSDAKFPDWWKKQPSYVSFETWLSQEEERRKAGGVACPTCGTLNPRGSSICHRCGSTLEAPKIEEPKKAEDEKPKPLRRIVRRPVEKKATAKTDEGSKATEEKPEEKKDDSS